MKRQVVDPFVVTSPAHNATNAAQPAHTAPKPPKPVKAGVSLVDGFMPASVPTAMQKKPVKPPIPVTIIKPIPLPKPALKPAAKPTLKPGFKPMPPQPPLPQPNQRLQSRLADKFPKGPLYVDYLPKKAPALSNRPEPAKVSKPVVKPPVTTASTNQADIDAVLAKAGQLKKPRSQQANRSGQLGKMLAWSTLGMLIAAGLSLMSSLAVETLLLAYAIAALWRRWPSQLSFLLALAMFVGIVVASLISTVDVPALGNAIEPAERAAKNLAVYAFILLCIGTFVLAVEVLRDARGKKPKKT